MDFLGYKLTFGQIIITIMLGLASAIIYNKILNPSISKFFDFISKATKTTKNMRSKNLEKIISICNTYKDDGIKLVLRQNYYKSRMIVNSSLYITALLILCFGQSNENYIYVKSVIQKDAPDIFKNSFLFESLDEQHINLMLWVAYAQNALNILALFLAIFIFRKLLKDFLIIFYLSDPQRSIKSLQERIKELNN